MMKQFFSLRIKTMLASLLAVCGLMAKAQPSQTSDQFSSQTDQYSSQKLKIKRGSLDDVNAIGQRSIKGFNWYSQEKENEVCRKFVEQMDASVKFVQDPVITEYVNRIAQLIARNSDAKVPFTIEVVDSPQPKAFALPGGPLYVDTGLLRTAQNEAEMVGVIAHAIAHVAARHMTRLLTQAQFANIAAPPLITANSHCNIYAACEQDQSIGLPATFLKSGRTFETEADYLGVQYLYRAGYEPMAFVAFLQRLEPKEKKTVAGVFDAHPPLAKRIADIQKEIRTILPRRDHSILDSPDFQRIKALLANEGQSEARSRKHSSSHVNIQNAKSKRKAEVNQSFL